VPAIGSVTDFSTIDLYYGKGSIQDGDAAIYAGMTGEQAVPYIACYLYLDGDSYSILLVNRHLDVPADIRITHRLMPLEAVWLALMILFVFSIKTRHHD